MGVLDDAIKEHLDLKRRRGADPAEIEKAEREALGPVRRDPSARALSEQSPVSYADPVAPPEDFLFDDDHASEIASAPEPLGGIPAHEEELDDDFPAPASEFDLPDAGPIAAMPPEPADKPKRRHLFHFRSHHNDVDFEDDRELPSELPDDDPFLEQPAAAAPRVVPPPAIPEPLEPRDESEAVGRAQPVSREEPVAPPPALQISPQPIIPEPELGHTVEYDVEQAFAEEDGTGEDILEETPDFLADTPDHDRLWFEQKPPPDFDFDN